MKKAPILIAVVLILVFASACGGADSKLTQTQTAVSEEIFAQSTKTANAVGTQQAETQAYEAELAQTSEAQEATEMAKATDAAIKATRLAGEQQTLVARTQEAEAQATQAAERIYTVVQDLYDQGFITSKEGSFQQLPPYEGEFAQIGYYRSVPIPDSFVKDFVLVMDVSWEVNDKANEWYRSGCGFAFRVSEDYDEYYNFILTLDGRINFAQLLKGYNGISISKAYWGQIENEKGSDTIIITAQGKTFQVFNTDLERIDIRYGEKLVEGTMAYQVSSGSNKDFGTRCNFTDVDLWHLDD
ncbi:MAG: hypothetical protein ACK2T7_07790 [Anaerolineales bacterium]